MSSFKKTLSEYSWDEVLQSIFSKTEADVRAALQSRKRNLEDFKALISPAARPFLEQMAQQSKMITKNALEIQCRCTLLCT